MILASITAMLFTLPVALQESPSVTLLRDFLAAVNSKERTQIETFYNTRAVPGGPPVSERATRLLDIADQGAPFKVEGPIKVEGNLVRAMIVDREGITLSVEMTTEGTPPKLLSILLKPVTPSEPEIENWSTLDGLAAALTTKRRTPGAAVATRKDGKTTVGVAGVREFGKDAKLSQGDPLKIGSIGKPLCTTLIGILIEKGKLRWDQTLKDSLPNVEMKAGYESVTLEQIMRHRGGIPQDETYTRARIDGIIGDEKSAQGMRARYAKDILNRDPIAKPDERFAYSNAGYTLLGYIAEATMGKSYEALIQEYIFDPLGLKASFVGLTPPRPEWPVGHLQTPQGLRPHTLDGPLAKMLTPAGGGTWMSISDLVRFGEEHLKGLKGEDGLLKADTVKRLHRGVSEGFGGGMKYACGWGINRHSGLSESHGHNGSDGTMRAELQIFPEKSLVVAAIVTSGGEVPMPPSLEAVLAIARRFH